MSRSHTEHRFTARAPSERAYQLGCRCDQCRRAWRIYSRRYNGAPDNPAFDEPWLVLNFPVGILDRSLPDSQAIKILEECDDRSAAFVRRLGPGR